MSDYDYEESKKRQDAWERKKAMTGDKPAPISNFSEKLAYDLERVSKEKEQEVLDLLHAGNNVGKVAEITGLDSLIVAKLLSKNVKYYGSYLAKKVDEE